MPNVLSRRACLGAVAAAAAASTARAAAPSVALTNRGHFLARPEYKADLLKCFSEVLGLGPPALLRVPTLAEPIVAYRLPGGGAFSVEFTPDALAPVHARRGAWLELRCDNAVELQQAVLAAGYPKVEYLTHAFYFEAPGGQVFGIVGPGQAP